MSDREEILKNLVVPLVSVFGEFREGHVKWLMDNCQKYSPQQLRDAADKTIRKCPRFPYPAVVMEILDPPQNRNPG
jgi:hypothetical protein